MSRISEDDINLIRQKADISAIIGEYIPLSKSGNDYVGICPFHSDHSPSMRVSTKLNIYKCFVCNAGGNVFNFVKNYENVSYIEAIKIVAEKSGIDFKFNESIGIRKNAYEKEFALMDTSLKFYQNNLATKSGVSAKKYLLSRGIDDEIIKEFKIGLSLDNNNLKSFFESRNLDLELGYNLGIINKDGINYYDMFVNRIMIPIFDMSGMLAGYTARAYLKDEKSKYINSKETIIYKKSNILFNFYNAKDEIRNKKELIIVEGNMDAISMSCHGIKNVIALMGVVISKYQIEAIKKLNSKVILMLDNDDAGKQATLKVGDELYNAGVNLYVVRLSDYKDPDEYVRAKGDEALKTNIEHAIKYLDYKLEVLKENRNLENFEELASYVKEVLLSLEHTDDFEKDIIISKLSSEYNIDKDIIVKNLKKKDEVVVHESSKEIKKRKLDKYQKASMKLVYALLLNKDYYDIYLKKLGYLLNEVERDTVNLIKTYISKNGDIDISGFLDYVVSYEDVSNYVNEVLTSFDEEILEEIEFYDILNTVSNCIDEKERKDIKLKIKNEMDVAKKIELINRLTKLKKGSGTDEGN